MALKKRIIRCVLTCYFIVQVVCDKPKLDKCLDSKKEAKGANKLKKYLAQEEERKRKQQEELKAEWLAWDKASGLSLGDELNIVVKSSSLGACQVSNSRDQIDYKDCQEVDLTSFSKSKSLLAAFTNGRLGNQMCAFASIYALSKMFELEPVLLRSQFLQLKKYFPRISEDLVIEKKYCHHCNLPWMLKNTQAFTSAATLGAKFKPGLAITLPPYANEPEFYKEYLPEIKQLFTLDDTYLKLARERIRDILQKFDLDSRPDVLLIGVHLRGTDFAAIAKMERKKHQIYEKFYSKAFEFMRKRFSDKIVRFLVVSDEPKFAVGVLKLDPKTLTRNDVIMAGVLSDDEAKFSPDEGAGVDLAILASCSHVITAFSTFGMWAAHLAGGLAVVEKTALNYEIKTINANFNDWYFMSDD